MLQDEPAMLVSFADEPRAALECEIFPKPIGCHDYSIARSDQEKHVSSAPKNPAKKTFQSKLLQGNHG